MTTQSIPTLKVVNGQPATSSLDAANFFGKLHKDVLEAIRKIKDNCPESFNAGNFPSVKIKDAKGETRPAYYLTRDGFTLLAMGFTGPKALKFKLAYIEAFNKMEAELSAKNLPALTSGPDAAIEPRESGGAMHGRIFHVLEKWGPATVRNLARLTCLDCAQVRGALGRLECKGLVKKENIRKTRQGPVIVIWSASPVPAISLSKKLPLFDPNIMAKVAEAGAAHPENRPVEYAAHKYESFCNKTVALEDELLELQGRNLPEQSAPEAIEAYQFLARFEDMARAFPHVMACFHKMEHDIMSYKLKLARIEKAMAQA